MDEATLRQMAAQLRKPSGEEGVNTGNWMNKGNESMNRKVITTLDPKPGDSILEIGMGNGKFVSEIVSSDSSIQYTGCDFSEVMVSESERNNETLIKIGQAKFVQSDARSMPFENESFNKIFTINTLYFWEHDSEIAHEIKRVLKPGGIFLVAIRPKALMLTYPFTQYGFRMFTLEEASHLFQSYGFSVISATQNPEPDFEFNGMMMKLENIVLQMRVVV